MTEDMGPEGPSQADTAKTDTARKDAARKDAGKADSAGTGWSGSGFARLSTLTLSRTTLLTMAGVGLLAGFLSGLFGIGGGTVIVPALVFCGMTQRRAAATSLAAIVPTSIVGVVSYAVGGNVDWVASLLLAVGVVVGAQGGSWLLDRLPETVLRWAFAAFLLVVIIQQFIVTPARDSIIDIHPLSGVGLVLMGVGIGVLSGILGIGGGSIMVPALTVVFHASDLVARGSSLLAMFPGAISGTVGNMRRRNVDLLSGLVVGVFACLLAPVGTLAASALSPRANSLLFAGYLAFLLLRSLWVALRRDKGVGR